MESKETNLFYNALFDTVSVMDVDEFSYPRHKLSNHHFLDLVTSMFKNNFDLLNSLPPWCLMLGLSKLSTIVSSNENYSLGEILTLESILEERKILWLDDNERFFTQILELSHDQFTEEACRVYWDNLNMYGDLTVYSKGGGFFKHKLKEMLKKYL
jgi:hypothetical protein